MKNTLTFVHKNGIVNIIKIETEQNFIDNIFQIIWDDEIRYYKYIKSLGKQHLITHSIKSYRAIYIDNIMIVKNGNVYPKRHWWQF